MNIVARVHAPKFATSQLLRDSVPAVRRELLGPTRAIVTKSFTKRVRNWRTRVSTRSRYSRPTNTLGQLRVVPSGPQKAVKLWAWVSIGTRPHVISARNMPTLRFRLGYIRKTLPGNVYGRAGGFSIGRWMTPRKIKHPGIEARDFERHIREEVVDRIESRLSRVIDRQYQLNWPIVAVFTGPRVSVR